LSFGRNHRASGTSRLISASLITSTCLNSDFQRPVYCSTVRPLQSYLWPKSYIYL
jgi:hypothetical protein